MDISFIIVNYKSLEYLDNCLKSISNKAKNINFEIIIVNNDEIKLDTFKNEIIKTVEINTNVGFGKAHNIGVSKSQGDLICLINPDTEMINGELGAIIEKFKNNSEIGIIGPKIIQKNNGSKINKQNDVVQVWSVGVDLNICELLRGKLGIARSKKFWQSNKELEVDWVTGASMFIRKKDFLKVGGFDENFFLYYEDLDLCKRIKRLGRKVIYMPSFQIWHLGGKSSSSLFRQKTEYFKSQEYYYKKWFSFPTQCLLKFFRFFYLLRYKILNIVEIFLSGKTKNSPKN